MNKIFSSICMGICLIFNIGFLTDCSGDSVLIGVIEFEGNSILKRETLSDLIAMKAGEKFDDKRLKTGLQKILTEYKKLDRPFATVTPVMRRIRSDQIQLVVKIDEGKALKIGEIQFKGNDLFYTRELLDELGMVQSRLFDPVLFEQGIDQILRLYSEHGHPLAEITLVDFQVNENGAVNFTMRVDEKELVKISDVKITGLNKTKPNIILRELPVHSGDQFDQRKVDESYRILRNIGYFYDLKQGLLEPGNSPSEIVFNAKVTEARTGLLNGVIGYDPSARSDQGMSSNGTNEGKWTGMIEVTETNLFGTGRKLDFLWKSGMLELYKLGYEEPWIFGHPINAGIEFSAINQTDQLTQLVSKERSASFSIGTHLHRKFGGKLTAIYKRINLPEISYDAIQSSTQNANLRTATGSKYAIKFSLQRDSRDYRLNPTRGRLDRVAFEVSRGDFRMKKFWLGLNQYFAIREKQVLAIGLHGAACYGEEIPPTELLYLGGSNNLRGYGENLFRGMKRLYSNIEYRFLVGRTSQVFLFTDLASITAVEKTDQFGKLRVGYGFGVRLESRSGILRIDYGLARGDSPLEGKIHVNLGLVR